MRYIQKYSIKKKARVKKKRKILIVKMKMNKIKIKKKLKSKKLKKKFKRLSLRSFNYLGPFSHQLTENQLCLHFLKSAF